MAIRELSLILLIVKIIDVTHGQTVTPTISNFTGDYYDIINTTIPNKIINCSSDKGCHIRCGLTNSCKSAQIIGPPTWLYLECTAFEACTNMFVAVTPTQSATIICQSEDGSSCSKADLNLTNTPIVDVICNSSASNDTIHSDGSCYRFRLRAPNSNQVSISCVGTFDCRDTDIIVNNTAEVNIISTGNYNFMLLQAKGSEIVKIDCIGGHACYSSDFWLENVNTVTINCRYDEACRFTTVHAEQADTVNINCIGDYSCNFGKFFVDDVTIKASIIGTGQHSLDTATISGVNAAKLNVTCGNERACEDALIYPPYQSIDNFVLYCGGGGDSYNCYDVFMFLLNISVIVDNYMQLMCSPNNSTCHELRWICESDNIYTGTELIYDSTSESYYCDNRDCCPRSDLILITEDVESSMSSVIVTVIVLAVLVVVIGGFIFYRSKVRKKESVRIKEMRAMQSSNL